jgi:PadR family transcriptional regulator, regulatory protein AphA
MDLHSVILGLLSWRPASGYDLKQIISDSDVFYWSGNNNQVYKSLLELEKEGLVTHRVQPQEGLPAKKIYSITEKGQSTLKESLFKTPELPELHKNFLVQLAWTELLSDEQVLELLGKYEVEIADRLSLLQGKASRSGGTPDRSPREKYLWKRIHANLVSACQGELEWVKQTKRELRQQKYLE